MTSARMREKEEAELFIIPSIIPSGKLWHEGHVSLGAVEEDVWGKTMLTGRVRETELSFEPQSHPAESYRVRLDASHLAPQPIKFFSPILSFETGRLSAPCYPCHRWAADSGTKEWELNLNRSAMVKSKCRAAAHHHLNALRHPFKDRRE